MLLNESTYRRVARDYAGPNLVGSLPGRILELWHENYIQDFSGAELVTVTLDSNGSSFTYLFDLTRQQNVGVGGLPTFVQHRRDASRMAGSPLGAGSGYHRGHMMAHSIGGNADINLIPQLGSLNIGSFRVIERLVRQLALENLQCVYFVRTIYPRDQTTASRQTQLPEKIEQCAVFPSGNLQYQMHNNF